MAASRCRRAWSAGCAPRYPPSGRRGARSGAGRLAAVVALGPSAPGEARRAALAALAAVNLVKLVTVVDADIDPWDDAVRSPGRSRHARAFRSRLELPGLRADRAEPLELEATIAKLAIDATRKPGDRDDWTAAEPPLRQ